MRYPPDFTHPYAKLRLAYLAADRIATLISDRRAVVQAGGCSGLWPVALATYFAHVYTFEPEPMNFECLEANVAAVSNISAFPYAVGDTQAVVGMTRPKAGAGLWRVEGDGEIPMVTLDEMLGDTPIDAIVLDVEGAELPAWRGAARMIARDRPLLWFEYLHDTAGIDDFLHAHGYTPPAHGIGGDAYSVHASKEQ